MSPTAVVIWPFKNSYILSDQTNYWNSKIKLGLEGTNKQWLDISKASGKPQYRMEK